MTDDVITVDAPDSGCLGERSPVFEKMFDMNVIACIAKPSPVCDLLYQSEKDYISCAVSSRKAEFGTSRLLARSALRAADISPQPLVPHSDRSPTWPDGVIGSISHTRNLCAVVISVDKDLYSLGFDIEDVQILDSSLTALILTGQEHNMLSSVTSSLSHLIPTIIFSIKESVFKCQFPLTGRFIDFSDIEIELDFDTQRYSVISANPDLTGAYHHLLQIHGCFGIYENHVVSSASIIATSPKSEKCDD